MVANTRGRQRNGDVAGTARRSATVAVVGAGPVGLAAALILADGGYDVVLVGPRAPADERTSALLAGSIVLLQRVGVWPGISEEAASLRTLRIVDATHRLIRAPEVTFRAKEIGRDAFGYNVPNSTLIAALEAAVAEAGIRRVDALAETARVGAEDIAVGLSNGDDVTTRLVVAADGNRSRMRAAAGIATNTWRYDQSALVCNICHTLPHDDTSTEFHTETGPFTLVPLTGKRSSLVWVDRPDETSRRLGSDDGTLAAEIEERSAAILGGITVDGGRQAFPLAGMSARRFAAGRVMLVGEAAHLFPPIGAQGLNLGYRDVAALAEVLAGPLNDPGADGACAAYDRARRTDVVTRTAAVDALNRTLLSDFLPVQGLRGLGLFLVDRVPALKRLAMRQGLAAG